MQSSTQVKLLTFSDKGFIVAQDTQNTVGLEVPFVLSRSSGSANRLALTILNLLSDNKKCHLIGKSFVILDLLPCTARDLAALLRDE